MTNREKFKEVFGYTPYTENMCVAPIKICEEYAENGKDFGQCGECPFKNWWDKEYKPCFKLREDFE